MSDCCCAGPADARSTELARCVRCGAKSHAVEELTVKALLTETALQRFESGAHCFCANPACDVVYVDLAGRTFTTSDVRVRVWQKEPPGRRTICYCFGENESDIRRDLVATGTSAAVKRVRGHIAAQRCACEVRNPRGTCCLGDVIGAVERARLEIPDPVSEP